MGHHSVTERCKTGSASDLVEVESHDFNRGSVSNYIVCTTKCQYNHSVMLVLTLDFFSCMPLLNLFNFDIGGCPVFSEKISFADVIGCTR